MAPLMPASVIQSRRTSKNSVARSIVVSTASSYLPLHVPAATIAAAALKEEAAMLARSCSVGFSALSFFLPLSLPIAIVDWKTGSSKTADHAQLQIYRYGLHMEDRNVPPMSRVVSDLWFPNGAGSFIGWFHHLDANKIQIVDPYLGNTVVQHWLTMTSAYKKAMVEENTIVATNSFLCQNYNNAQALCPTCAPEPTEVKEWHEILGRLERAKVQKVPTGLLSSEDSHGKDDDG